MLCGGGLALLLLLLLRPLAGMGMRRSRTKGLVPWCVVFVFVVVVVAAAAAAAVGYLYYLQGLITIASY